MDDRRHLRRLCGGLERRSGPGVDAAEVGQSAGADPDTAAESLQAVGGHAVTAIVTLLADCTAKGQPGAWIGLTETRERSRRPLGSTEQYARGTIR
ncbi:hypothetical protein [Streptomyces sp. NPDC006527]|uniref:hypothetical protein n=1 Tax=Streptomyces sp. NPDC006527 TaxID=3364749 RepID=UPI0036C65572